MKVDARRKEARSTGKVPFFTSYVKLKLKLIEKKKNLTPLMMLGMIEC